MAKTLDDSSDRIRPAHEQTFQRQYASGGFRSQARTRESQRFAERSSEITLESSKNMVQENSTSRAVLHPDARAGSWERTTPLLLFPSLAACRLMESADQIPARSITAGHRLPMRFISGLWRGCLARRHGFQAPGQRPGPHFYKPRETQPRICPILQHPRRESCPSNRCSTTRLASVRWSDFKIRSSLEIAQFFLLVDPLAVLVRQLVFMSAAACAVWLDEDQCAVCVLEKFC